MIDNGSEEIDVKTASRKVLYIFFRHLNKIALFFGFWFMLSVVFFILQRNTFKLNYYISSDYLSGQKIELILSDVKNLIDREKYSDLSSLLMVPESDLKKITSFKMSTFQPDMILSSNLSPSPAFFFNETNTEIKMELKDSLDMKRLVDALNQYLSGSQYFKKIRKNEQVIMDMVNKNLEDQKKVLDSINQINISKFINPSSNIIFANDISEIKRNIYSIEERLINNKRGLVRIEDPVNLINYPILKKESFVDSFLGVLFKSLITTIFLWLVWFVSKSLSYHYRRYKETI